MKNFSERFSLMNNFILNLQNDICKEIENHASSKFREDKWERKEGGVGITRVIENDITFEKGGVNSSLIFGEMPESIAKQLNIKPEWFSVCGLSIVIHPFSPKIPTIHMNIRFFETESGISWFGGGIDLTPYFPFEEDFIHFHKTMFDAVESVQKGNYYKYKKECDEYFYIKHRNEMRGIGGIFFDYLDGKDETNFLLVKSVGQKFLDSYIPIVRKRKSEIFTEKDKNFQLYRRGRYVEFNLIYDRGTIFGLKTNGRIESILMSLPPVVNYKYDWKPEIDSPYETMNKYYQPFDWLKNG